MRIPLKDYKELELALEQLRRDSQSPARPFDRVVIDTIDSLTEMYAKYLAEVYQTQGDGKWKGTDIRQWGAKGAGYTILTDACWTMLQTLERWGYAWTVVGHLKEETITTPDGKSITCLRPVLSPMFSALLAREADVVALIETAYVEQKKYKTIRETGQQIEIGVEQIKRIRFNACVQEVGLGAGTGKIRGVANLDMAFLLPHFGPDQPKTGWEEFCDQYRAASAKVSQGIFA